VLVIALAIVHVNLGASLFGLVYRILKHHRFFCPLPEPERLPSPFGTNISYSQKSPISVFPWDWDAIYLCSVITFLGPVNTIATRMLLVRSVVTSFRWPRSWYAFISRPRSSERYVQVQFVPQREHSPCPLWTPVRECCMGNRSLTVMRIVWNMPNFKMQNFFKLLQVALVGFKRLTTSIIRTGVDIWEQQ
jgi:hypothetical protein